MTDSSNQSRTGDARAVCTVIEPWFLGHGVPQFMHRYSASDRLGQLVLLLLSILAFECSAGPWLGLSATQLLLAPLVLICLALWASPALVTVADLPRTTSPRTWSVAVRLLAFGIAGYLLARSDLPPLYSDPWVDFAVLFAAAVIVAMLSSRTLWMEIEGSQHGRLLAAMVVLAVVLFALEGSVFPQFDALLSLSMPQALPALAVMASILAGALLLSRATRRSEHADPPSDRAIAAYVPAVPLLVLVFGGETAILPHAAGDGLNQAAWPLGLLLALAAMSALAARRAATLDAERLRTAVSGRAVLLWWIAPLFVVAYPLIAFFYLEVDVFGWRVEGPLAFLVTAGINLLLLLVAVLVVRVGLDRVAVWAGREALGNLQGIGAGLARGLPLLLVFTVFFFMQQELWHVVTYSTGGYLVLVGVLFGLGLLLLLHSSVREIIAASKFDSWKCVSEAALGTPGDPSAPTDPHFRREVENLAASQSRLPELNLRKLGWFNAAAIVTTYQALIFVPITAAAGFLFFGLGHRLVPKDVANKWINGDSTEKDPDLLVEAPLFDQPWTRVAIALAAFSFLYLVVDILSDNSKRSAFLGSADGGGAIRQRFAIRLAYLKLVPAVERDRLRKAGVSSNPAAPAVDDEIPGATRGHSQFRGEFARA